MASHGNGSSDPRPPNPPVGALSPANLAAESTDVSWEDAWREGRTRWDAGKSSPTLLLLEASGRIAELLASVEPAGPRRLLVPGAGSGYDVLTLSGADRHVTGVDLAPSAVERFAKLRLQAGHSHSTSYLNRDFLALAEDPEHHGAYDLIWDYTFFCALPPRLREAWGSAMERLLRPSGVLLTLMYPLVEGSEVDRSQGPPFPLSREIYEHHLLSGGRGFELEQLRPAHQSHPGREGKECFAVWRRTRVTPSPGRVVPTP